MSKSRLPVLALLAACAPAPVAAEPALWSVSDADSTIYLFGTAHAVRKDAGWRTGKINAAMKASTDLWLEIEEELGRDPAAMAPIIQRYGLDPARPLSSKLSPAQNRKLAAALKSYGVPPAQLEPMRPWLAAVTIGTLPFAKAGLDPAAGADRTLRGVAVGEGDAIHGFETVEQQLRFLADFSEAEQIAFLESALDDAAEGPAQLAEISDAWEKGDMKTLDRIIVDEMKDEEPALYRRLIVERNIAWAKRIRALLAGRGTTFVAVGVGHLVGPDSVQAQLAKAGIRAVRR